MPDHFPKVLEQDTRVTKNQNPIVDFEDEIDNAEEKRQSTVPRKSKMNQLEEDAHLNKLPQSILM